MATKLYAAVTILLYTTVKKEGGQKAARMELKT